jgi:hypothetical protein
MILLKIIGVMILVFLIFSIFEEPINPEDYDPFI